MAARAVAPHRREILQLQRIARRGWRAAEVAELDGWQLHADRGWTGRANSVLPLATPHRPLPELLAEAARFYAERGLPLQVQMPLPARGLLDAELAGRCWTLERPTTVLTSPVAGPAEHRPPGWRLEAAPSADWLAGYHYRGGPLPEHAVRLLTRHDQVRFASARRDGAVVGVARGTVDEGWLGVTAVEVAPEHRRGGVGRRADGRAAGLGRRLRRRPVLPAGRGRQRRRAGVLPAAGLHRAPSLPLPARPRRRLTRAPAGQRTGRPASQTATAPARVPSTSSE